MRREILTAQTVVDVPVEQARDWFFSLEEHPERYQFETHEGFEFVEGSFGEVGARFKTRERFFFLKLELLFELTEVGESEFWFRLVRPGPMQLWGRFDIDREGEERSLLSLAIGSETRVGQLTLRSFPVATAVHRQIHGEVGHIKASMERAYSSLPSV
ncbi:MAG: hypothetical protein PVG71_00605 [Anaerolineae bacterium]|jgi:hypothetical protein